MPHLCRTPGRACVRPQRRHEIIKDSAQSAVSMLLLVPALACMLWTCCCAAGTDSAVSSKDSGCALGSVSATVPSEETMLGQKTPAPFRTVHLSPVCLIVLRKNRVSLVVLECPTAARADAAKKHVPAHIPAYTRVCVEVERPPSAPCGCFRCVLFCTGLIQAVAVRAREGRFESLAVRHFQSPGAAPSALNSTFLTALEVVYYAHRPLVLVSHLHVAWCCAEVLYLLSQTICVTPRTLVPPPSTTVRIEDVPYMNFYQHPLRMTWIVSRMVLANIGCLVVQSLNMLGYYGVMHCLLYYNMRTGSVEICGDATTLRVFSDMIRLNRHLEKIMGGTGLGSISIKVGTVEVLAKGELPVKGLNNCLAWALYGAQDVKRLRVYVRNAEQNRQKLVDTHKKTIKRTTRILPRIQELMIEVLAAPSFSNPAPAAPFFYIWVSLPQQTGMPTFPWILSFPKSLLLFSVELANIITILKTRKTSQTPRLSPPILQTLAEVAAQIKKDPRGTTQFLNTTASLRGLSTLEILSCGCFAQSECNARWRAEKPHALCKTSWPSFISAPEYVVRLDVEEQVLLLAADPIAAWRVYNYVHRGAQSERFGISLLPGETMGSLCIVLDQSLSVCSLRECVAKAPQYFCSKTLCSIKSVVVVRGSAVEKSSATSMFFNTMTLVVLKTLGRFKITLDTLTLHSLCPSGLISAGEVLPSPEAPLCTLLFALSHASPAVVKMVAPFVKVGTKGAAGELHLGTETELDVYVHSMEAPNTRIQVSIPSLEMETGLAGAKWRVACVRLACPHRVKIDPSSLLQTPSLFLPQILLCSVLSIEKLVLEGTVVLRTLDHMHAHTAAVCLVHRWKTQACAFPVILVPACVKVFMGDPKPLPSLLLEAQQMAEYAVATFASVGELVLFWVKESEPQDAVALPAAHAWRAQALVSIWHAQAATSRAITVHFADCAGIETSAQQLRIHTTVTLHACFEAAPEAYTVVCVNGPDLEVYLNTPGLSGAAPKASLGEHLEISADPGVPESVPRLFPSVCLICYTALGAPLVAVTQCGHLFHEACLGKRAQEAGPRCAVCGAFLGGTDVPAVLATAGLPQGPYQMAPYEPLGTVLRHRHWCCRVPNNALPS